MELGRRQTTGLLRQDKKYSVKLFIDDDQVLQGRKISNVEVQSPSQALVQL